MSTIGDYFNIKGGKRLPKGSSLSETPTKHAYIRVTDFKKNGLKSKGIKYISPEVHQQIHKYTINSNSVYLSIAGTIGIAGIIPEEEAVN